MNYQVWTEEEIALLKDVFETGYSLKEMANLLNRSVTGISKALSRFGIRAAVTLKNPVSSRRKRGRAPHTTITQLLLKRRALNTQKKNALPLPLLQEILRSTHAVEAEPSWIHRPTRREHTLPYAAVSRMKHGRQHPRNVECTLSFGELISWLHVQGFVIREQKASYQCVNNVRSAPCTYKVSLRGIFTHCVERTFTPGQLLTLTNKIRLKLALPPFFVESLTEF